MNIIGGIIANIKFQLLQLRWDFDRWLQIRQLEREIKRAIKKAKKEEKNGRNK